jgi:ferric-dicitrate binding protein FerR (iron transport regulator)
MDFQLINKYLQGETSEVEVAEIFQWIDADPENRKEFTEYKKVWALTARGDENETHLWRLMAPQFRQKQTNLYLQLVKYAAVFFLLIGTGIAIQYAGFGFGKDQLVYQKSTTIAAPLGQMTNVELPDGTMVMLNSGSSLTYNVNYALGKRQVTLNGEAYFDVAHDQKHPFFIQTSHLDFKVYGTSFNIEAYQGEKSISTTLVDGSLGVMDKSEKEILLLSPGENAYFDTNTSKITVNKVNTDLYTSWKVGLITFRNEKLKDIARKIERWYNVKIVINNERVGEQAYFGTIMKNKPVDQILEVLKLTSSLKYKIITRPDKPTLIYWN